MSADFSGDQKRYFEGFTSGITAARAASARSSNEAAAFVGESKKSGRFQQDVY